MKRKTFIVTTTVAALAIASVPVVKYYSNRRKTYPPLIMPDDLSRFCDEKTIREIGVEYRKSVPLENEKIKLEQILLADNTGKIIPTSDKLVVAELMDKKTLEDFKEFRIHTFKGWIISTTEARQCALFSLT